MAIWSDLKTDCGAVGDGVTDDTAAITTWLASGQQLYMPNGTYLDSLTRTLNINQDIFGDGSAYVSGVSSTVSAWKYTGTGTHIKWYSTSLRNIALVGNANANGGVQVGDSTPTLAGRASMKQVMITGYTKTNAYGIQLLAAVECLWEDVDITGNYRNLDNPSGTNCTTCNFVNLQLLSAVERGADIRGLTSSDFTNLQVESNGQEGLYFYGANAFNINFFGGHVEANCTSSGAQYVMCTGANGSDACYNINFFGTKFPDEPSGSVTRMVKMDYATSINLIYPFLKNTATGNSYIEATANAVSCTLHTPWAQSPTNSGGGNTDSNLRVYAAKGYGGFALTPNSATPSVGGGLEVFKTANTGTTTITNFLDGYDGQVVTIAFSDTKTIINNGGNFSLNTNIDTSVRMNGGSITLVNRSGTWYEVSRSTALPPKVVSFTRDVSVASGTQAVTGVGFKPSAVIFIAIVGTTNAGVSWGWDDGTGTQALLTDITNGAGAYSYATADSIYLAPNGGTAYHGKIQSFDSDGFTVSWTKVGSPTGTAQIFALCFR